MNKKQQSILKKATKKLSKDELVLSGDNKYINPRHKLKNTKSKKQN